MYIDTIIKFLGNLKNTTLLLVTTQMEITTIPIQLQTHSGLYETSITLKKQR